MGTFSGIVQKGTRRAAALGFPTVNIPLEDSRVSGIYAALVKVDAKEYPAAAYADQKQKVLEAHVLDASLDLYGKEVIIELLKKIRDDKSFENDNALRSAVAADIVAVRKYFANGAV
ncbi:hypothetical protein A3A39_04440 [Candidatus Kaiserbacteria bacterium RIFCSPLOWO2_01_FULL_54_13]|uniref:riboflavin kinase n=1 Tax=Candidatus Kaiserbacteria bacterium RIFCSPLOWO2_01_FULL_54_13 TaxID=1798512 RepID=A0A1F6F1J6_9BACT|nr:MAG: hypothetical protein A3A39_04440 [Candidatus Kaiserbacteria bacterium RIFCSPLOWO2_01_FULL_54_13]